jgi:hypothetical protein
VYCGSSHHNPTLYRSQRLTLKVNVAVKWVPAGPLSRESLSWPPLVVPAVTWSGRNTTAVASRGRNLIIRIAAAPPGISLGPWWARLEDRRGSADVARARETLYNASLGARAKDRRAIPRVR